MARLLGQVLAVPQLPPSVSMRDSCMTREECLSLRGFTVTPDMTASAQAAGTRASLIVANLRRQRMALVSALAQRVEAAIKQEPGRGLAAAAAPIVTIATTSRRHKQ